MPSIVGIFTKKKKTLSFLKKCFEKIVFKEKKQRENLKCLLTLFSENPSKLKEKKHKQKIIKNLTREPPEMVIPD